MADITAVVQTNDNGDYTFDNLPDGSYEMMIDIPGLEMNRTYSVPIVGNQMHSGLDFIVDVESGIDIIWGVGINNKAVSPVKLYPNPGKGEIYIENSDESELFITIYSVDAKMVMATRIKQNSSSKYLDISHLESGIYFIKVESGTRNSVLKYILE